MKIFIRTKDGKITVWVAEYDVDRFKTYLNQFDNYKNQIVKGSVYIEDLVLDGDLIKIKDRMLNMEEIIIYKKFLDLGFYELLTLWTEQNGNYIKVWDKEEGVI